MTETSPELQAALDRMWDAAFPKPPRHTWFRPPAREKNGPMFGWTLEPVEGHYGSMVWWPRGKGARSNKAVMWQIVEDLTVVHDTRKDAKARALRLYNAYYEHGCTLAELLDGSYLDKTKG